MSYTGTVIEDLIGTVERRQLRTVEYFLTRAAAWIVTRPCSGTHMKDCPKCQAIEILMTRAGQGKGVPLDLFTTDSLEKL